MQGLNVIMTLFWVFAFLANASEKVKMAARDDWEPQTAYQPLMPLEESDEETDDNDLVVNETNIPIHECGDGNRGSYHQRSIFSLN